jgi:hypothetical protein
MKNPSDAIGKQTLDVPEIKSNGKKAISAFIS